MQGLGDIDWHRAKSGPPRIAFAQKVNWDPLRAALFDLVAERLNNHELMVFAVVHRSSAEIPAYIRSDSPRTPDGTRARSVAVS